MFHNEEFHILYRSPNILRLIKYRRLRWAGLVARMEESRGAFTMLRDKPTRKRPLGRPRSRLESNIKMDLIDRYQYEEFGCFGSG